MFQQSTLIYLYDYYSSFSFWNPTNLRRRKDNNTLSHQEHFIPPRAHHPTVHPHLIPPCMSSFLRPLCIHTQPLISPGICIKRYDGYDGKVAWLLRWGGWPVIYKDVLLYLETGNRPSLTAELSPAGHDTWIPTIWSHWEEHPQVHNRGHDTPTYISFYYWNPLPIAVHLLSLLILVQRTTLIKRLR